MITGEELKRMVNLIPDRAVVTINGNRNVDIISVDGEIYGHLPCWNLRLTPGFSIVTDEFLDGWADALRSAYGNKKETSHG